jgi:hypothetical protein
MVFFSFIRFTKQATMKKLFFLLFVITNSFFVSSAQSATKQLKKVLELKIPREGGANAAQVAWHPVQRKYYAAMAGNVNHCMGVFDASGKLLSATEQNTMFDVRGLWYNPNTKTLQMNGYNDFGWAEYELNAKGMPSSVNMLQKGMNQPDEQSVGAFNPKEKMIYFLTEDGNVDTYDEDALGDDYIQLHLGQKEEDGPGDNDEVIEEYNSTTILYTGIPKAELGLLNVDNKEIELYDIKTGYLGRKLALPDDAPVHNFLDFSYCNGIYWLFDTEARIWKGYK